ncbi:macrocin-O-methyltransferase [Ralstonia pickettii]|uniref:Macrocin-O-methyltransferase n=2 Tax=Pseudomonadota TaxID=1224 RepID=A0A7X2HLH6_RALPI|nr:TylF/MycF/NovP-related O-methyltransferase [Ralstonia pickettii]MRS98728.1 macrocin-O-methyltransferase [Ralstonia pickettii]NWK43842.1 class I SAM-dependent methyltransferase [Ralstonia pickettii]WKZ85977.1 TylF/MycF family methyltransferase [Ralstonia pickettii]
MERKKPAPCPDNNFVEEAIFSLVARQVGDGNRDAFRFGGLLRYVNRRALAKLICHYEIYKQVNDLPGHIVEFGVFKGESLLRFAQFSEIFAPYDRSFDVIGFDNFSGFPDFHEKDGARKAINDKVEGGWSSAQYREELYDLINVFDHDRFAPHKPRIRIIEGDIRQTVPQYASENPGTKIKLLHLDADLYEPTKVGLECLWDRLVKGGILLLDEYGFDVFPGEASAVDEFFRARGIAPRIQKFPFSDNPGGYIVKETY